MLVASTCRVQGACPCWLLQLVVSREPALVGCFNLSCPGSLPLLVASTCRVQGACPCWLLQLVVSREPALVGCLNLPCHREPALVGCFNLSCHREPALVGCFNLSCPGSLPLLVASTCHVTGSLPLLVASTCSHPITCTPSLIPDFPCHSRVVSLLNIPRPEAETASVAIFRYLCHHIHRSSSMNTQLIPDTVMHVQTL